MRPPRADVRARALEVVRAMTRTRSLYEACLGLFAAYPLASRSVNRSGTVCAMVLMLAGGDGAGFHVLSHRRGTGRSSFLIWPWPAGEIAEIEAGGDADVSDVAADAVTRGVPIPRDGSLLGWSIRGDITALVIVYAKYTPDSPEPAWSVMPLVGIPETQWPPFAGERLFGCWSWEDYRAGRIVSLDDLIARTPDTVFWVDTKAVLGSDCCAVARDATSPDGHTLRRGSYVYYEALRAGKPVPPLRALLADASKIDLASRFQRSGK